MFCSAPAGWTGALVVAAAATLVYVDLAEASRSTARGSAPRGMRASESHRVRFHGARVHRAARRPGARRATRGSPRDAIRTAACWAGIADAAAAAALDGLARRAAGRRPRALAVGRIVTPSATIDRWLEARRARPRPTPPCAPSRCTCARRSRVAGRRSSTRRRAPPGRARWRAAAPWTAPAATCASSCSSTGSTRCVARRTRGGATGERPAREHFEARYAADPDPWDFETSAYERAKYERTLAALGDRRYASGLRGRLLDRRPHRAAGRSLRRAARGRHRPDRGRGRARAPRAARTSRSSAARCPSSGRPARSTSSSARRSSTTGTARARGRAARDRALAATAAPGRRALPPAVDHRSADRRCRPRAPARAPRPARVARRRPPTTSSTSSTHADRHRRGRPGRADHRAQLPRRRRRGAVDAHLRRAAPALQPPAADQGVPARRGRARDLPLEARPGSPPTR